MEIQLRIPEPMITTENLAENWRKFKDELFDYIIAGGYDKKDDIVKIALFRNLIGNDGKELLKTFDISEDDLKEFDKIIKAFTDNCSEKVNVIYERYCFYSRKQGEHEKFDIFYTDVKKLAKTCEFADKENEMVRDRIIFGINNMALQEKLINKGAQELSKTLEACRLWERSKMQTEEIQQSSEVHHIQQSGTNKYTYKKNFSKENIKVKSDSNKSKPQASANKNNMCRKCNETHEYKNCPAYGYKCKRCRALHHFTKCCRSKSVNTVENEACDSDELCLDSLNLQHLDSNQSERCKIKKLLYREDNCDFFIDSINIYQLKTCNKNKG